MNRKPIVALIYDFDGTLSPGNMQEFGFIQAIHQTPEEFWTKSDGIAKGQDASNILSYMKLMHDEAKKNGIKLTRADFRRYGADIKLYGGVKEWFSNVNEYGKSKGVRIEHYINSSGLKEIIEGSPIAKEFRHIFAGSFIYDENGEAEWPGIAVDYTAKTQFLFKIQKGIFSSRDAKRVNESMADENKRIPFTWLDWAYMTYSFGNFSLSLGKDMVTVGGLEFDDYDFEVHTPLCSARGASTSLRRPIIPAKAALSGSYVRSSTRLRSKMN